MNLSVSVYVCMGVRERLIKACVGEESDIGPGCAVSGSGCEMRLRTVLDRDGRCENVEAGRVSCVHSV